jgi:hypothetical protein
MPLDPDLAGPLQDRPARKFNAIITDNAGWFPAQANQRIQFARHRSSRDVVSAGRRRIAELHTEVVPPSWTVWRLS